MKGLFRGRAWLGLAKISERGSQGKALLRVEVADHLGRQDAARVLARHEVVELLGLDGGVVSEGAQVVWLEAGQEGLHLARLQVPLG